MKLSCVSTFVCLLLLLGGTAQAAMVDFESPTYTAGTSWGDGWAFYSTYAGTTVVTSAAGGSGNDTVLSGSQSGKLTTGGTAIIGRKFDAGQTYVEGSTVGCNMMLQGTGTGSFYFSDNPLGGTSPGGISGTIGGKFSIFGAGGSSSSTVDCLANVNYRLEVEVNLDENLFTAFVTDVTNAGTRTAIGSKSLYTPVTPEMYPNSGFVLVVGSATTGIFDDFDAYVVDPNPPVPLLPEPVDFENEVYVAGNSVVGVDGWQQAFLGAGTNVVSNTAVLSGTKSLEMADDGQDKYGYILQRNLGEGTVFDDGYIISGKMMAKSDSADGSDAGLYFSNDQIALATPAGVLGVVGGNFQIFGKEDGQASGVYTIDTDVAFETDTEYLLEMKLNLTDQTFNAYVTDLTAGGERTLLGAAEFWNVVAAGDGTNAGYVSITHKSGVALFDDLDCKVPEPSMLTVLIGLILGAFVCVCRRKVA